MFLGQHKHSLDDKGRVILPAKFRSQLERGAFMARGRDGCVCVYPAEEWERVAENVQELSMKGTAQRQAARAFFAGAAEAVPDRQGRVPIPSHLREFAGLDGEVMVAGLRSRVEIWDLGRWNDTEQVPISPDDIPPGFGI